MAERQALSRQEEKERAFIRFVTGEVQKLVGGNFYGRLTIELKAGNIVFIKTEQTTQMDDLLREKPPPTPKPI